MDTLTGNGGGGIDSQTVLAVQSLIESHNVSESLTADEEDVFQCGRCKLKFSSLPAFLAHKQTLCNVGTPRLHNLPNDNIAVSLSLSGDQCIIGHNDGQGTGYICTGQLPHHFSNKIGAYVVPLHNFTQSLLQSDEILTFQPSDQSCPSAPVHMIQEDCDSVSRTGISSFLKEFNNSSYSNTYLNHQVVTSSEGLFPDIHPNGVVSMSKPVSGNVESSYCAFLSSAVPTGAFAVSENMCIIRQHDELMTEQLNQPVGTSSSDVSGIAGLVPQVILMQQQQQPLQLTDTDSGAVLSNTNLTIGDNQYSTGVLEQSVVEPQHIADQVATGGDADSFRHYFNAEVQHSVLVVPSNGCRIPSETTTVRQKRFKSTSSDSHGSSSGSASAARKCPYCDKSFTKNFDMQQHVRSHTGEKPFQCVVCGRGFTQKSNVKKHLQTHKVWPQGKSGTLPQQVIYVETISVDDKQDSANKLAKGASDGSITDDVESDGDAAVNNSSIHIIVEGGEVPVRTMISVHKELGHKEDDAESQMMEPTGSSSKVVNANDSKGVKFVIDNSYICQFCNGKFSNYFQLKSHMVVHKDEQVYKCVIKSCGESFHQLDRYLEHLKGHENQMSYRCHVCSKSFTSLADLGQHQYTHSLFPSQSPKAGAKSFHCLKCNSKFSSPEALQQHLETVSHDYHCPQPDCGKTFACERFLRRHLMVHGTSDNYICSHCNKSFKTEQYLKMHMVVHSAERPFQCAICKHAFNRKDKLKRHMVVHDPVKRFKCPLRSQTGCTKEFNRADKLKAHILLHSGVRPHVCKTCGRSFRRRSHLQEHERLHTSDCQLSCKNCGKGFTQDNLLLKHQSKCCVSVGAANNQCKTDETHNKRKSGHARKDNLPSHNASDIDRSGNRNHFQRTAAQRSNLASSSSAVDSVHVAEASDSVSHSSTYAGNFNEQTVSSDFLIGDRTTMTNEDVVSLDQRTLAIGSTEQSSSSSTSAGPTLYVFHPLVTNSSATSGGQQLIQKVQLATNEVTDGLMVGLGLLSSSSNSCSSSSTASDLTNLLTLLKQDHGDVKSSEPGEVVKL